MKKVLKIFLSVLVITAVIIPLVISASAEEIRVYDDAGLFTSSEKANLENEIKNLKDKYNHDFVIVTTNDTQGKTSRDYADDYYDYNGFGVGNNFTGFLLLLDMDNREIYISTCGDSIDYLTDNRLDKTLDKLAPKMKKADYYETTKLFLNQMSDYISIGVPDNQYRYDEDAVNVDPEKVLTGTEFAIALLISLAVGGIIVVIVVYKYSFAGKQSAYPLKENGKLNLTKREDVFVNKTVTHIRIQSSSSNNGSSTHTSSSGRSHGGGGRGF